MENPENQESQNFFQSATAKMFMIGLLTLVLLIPLVFVNNLIIERSERQKEVVSETADKWGESVYFYGPIIKVPYKIVNGNFLSLKLKNSQPISNGKTKTK